MGASGLLISRAAFGAGLEALGVACAVGLAMVALFTVRRARFADEAEAKVDNRGDPRPESLGLLTLVTVLIAVLAIVVTVAI